MKYLHHLGSILFVLSILMATGVDRNPIQALYAVLFIGIACVCFNKYNTWEQKQVCKRENQRKFESTETNEIKGAA